MLKYRINERNFLNNDNKLNVSTFNIVDVYNSDNLKKQIMVCTCDNLKGLKDKSKIVSRSIVKLSNGDNVLNEKTYEFLNDIVVRNVNENENKFTFLIDKLYHLKVNKAEIAIKDNVKNIYFYFETSHFFEKNDTIKLYLNYLRDGLIHYDEITFIYTSNNILRIKYDSLDDYLKNLLFKNNENVSFCENIKFYQDQFFYRDVITTTFFVDRPIETIKIPIQQKFETNMFQSDALQTNFVDYEKKKAINRINDLEKDVYIPMYVDKNNNSEPIYEIRFNLHFREHRGDDWLVSSESYWNGTYVDENEEVQFMNESDDTDKPFFSYKDESYQSDLLSYLNFTNTDVRFQKNKLKKSFLRLSFYDSVNPTNQNLLYYSTIFMDSGMYFTKYIKHIEDKPYSMMNYEWSEETSEYELNPKLNMTGIRVNREPMKDLINEHTNNLKEINLQWDVNKEKNEMDAIEELRLSSQFVVKDKYNSNSSSEGFYIYLWKDNEMGLMPQDLYMKVEFNHAGYGRTIPFMLPFWDNAKHGIKGIKTFEEILNDWNDKWEDEKWKNGTDGKYGARQYSKFSYIHFKYRYDNVNNQHIYYLDSDFYGEDFYNDDNILTINLYEAKMV